MKMNYLKKFLCVMLLICSVFAFGQVTTTISGLKVNNSTVSTINFGSNNSVNVELTVDLLTLNGNASNILGNIRIFSKNTPTSNPVELSFFGVVFTVEYPPFVPQDTYKNKTKFTFQMPRSAYLASGGVLYAEYKNNNGQSYKSTNISIVGGSQIAPPTGGYTTLEITRITYASNFQPTGEVILFGNDPNETSVSVNIEYKLSLPVGQSCSGIWILESANNSGGGDRSHIQVVPGDSCISNGAPITGYLNVNLNKSFFATGGTIKLDFAHTSGDLHWISQKIGVKIVDYNERSSISSNIHDISAGGKISLSGISTMIILGEVLDPRTNTMRQSVTEVENYKWYEDTGIGWTEITNSNLGNYIVNKTTSFMRQSLYKGIIIDSNVEKVVVRPFSSVNTICCDQNVSSSQPLQTIIGNVPTYEAPYKYDWQKRDSRTGDFISISGAINKDYTPPVSNYTGTYRRVVISRVYASIVFYSNEIKITNNLTNGKISDVISEDYEQISTFENEKLIIYPNPSSSIVTISGLKSTGKINVFDITGREISPSSINYNENNIEIDISNLPNATYLLAIESPIGVVYRKVVKN